MTIRLVGLDAKGNMLSAKSFSLTFLFPVSTLYCFLCLGSHFILHLTAGLKIFSVLLVWRCFEVRLLQCVDWEILSVSCVTYGDKRDCILIWNCLWICILKYNDFGSVETFSSPAYCANQRLDYNLEDHVV